MDPPQQWSVRAEFHISHPGLNDPKAPSKTDTVQDDSGVKMTYTWDPSEETSGTSEYASQDRESASGYVFQRGNICFSSTPPPRRYPTHTANQLHPTNHLHPSNQLYPSNQLHLPNQLHVPESSGYGSDLLSPSSIGGSSSRKCRSTCNIVLSANVHGVQRGAHCGRTQSLRCQTPSACCDRRSDQYYGCGDPWCHHLRYGDEFSRRISPVREMCEEAGQDVGNDSFATQYVSGSPFNRNYKQTCAPNVHPHYGAVDYDSSFSQCSFNKEPPDSVTNKISEVQPTHLTAPSAQSYAQASFRPLADHDRSVKRDVSVQTYNMVNKCTSPLLRSEESCNLSQKALHRKGDKIKRGKTLGSPRGSRCSSTSVASNNRRFLQQEVLKATNSPTGRNKSNEARDNQSPASDGKSSDSSKKPRTIHIDVYCTGTEIESDSSDSSDSSRSKSASTPQTVFESDKFCVTRQKADSDKLPYILKQKLKTESLSNNTSLEREDSDDDASTAYPSKLSSYSNIGCSFSSMSSFPNSYTMSNTTFPDLDTSWKDTFSDVGSLLNSRSSIGQTDSVYFVPRKIDEEAEDKEPSPKPSESSMTNSTSLQLSDSFEYANSEDRVRIKRMERLWKTKMNPKHSKTPLISPKLGLQQQDAVKLRLSKLNESKDTDSEVSDEDEKGWLFVKSDTRSVTSGDTIDTQIDVTSAPIVESEAVSARLPQSNQNAITIGQSIDPVTVSRTVTTKSPSNTETVSVAKTIFTSNQNSGRVSDSLSPSPSAVVLQERLLSNPHLRSPFTLLPGQYTEPRMIARRFGAVVAAFKKPGHHVGPAKNPNCLCDHCQRYFENSNYRSRACSLDSDRVSNWKNLGDEDDERRRRTFADF